MLSQYGGCALPGQAQLRPYVPDYTSQELSTCNANAVTDTCAAVGITNSRADPQLHSHFWQVQRFNTISAAV